MPDTASRNISCLTTAEGLAALKLTKPAMIRSVLPAETNDPVFTCDPQGFLVKICMSCERLRSSDPQAVVILYTYGRIWRVIWTDGRELPKDPEPRWFGYSVGKWVDDYTLVVQTSGTDERTWLDRAGRPHSAEFARRGKVPPRGSRSSGINRHDRRSKNVYETLVALDKLSFGLQPPTARCPRIHLFHRRSFRK